ncbi:MAG: hypothetical protein Q4P15_02595 [Propionibacteriaceae bacterium]|nr:hypothetical protein [Propionibacteriaceae bacterium]
MSDREERAADARRRVELGEQAARREATAAQILIDEFVKTALAQGMEPVPLKATTLDGHVVKTDKTGWYLRQNKSIAIDVDGGYHFLIVPGGWKERFRGVQLPGTQPSLTVGKGGRDGETGTLKEFISWVLAGQVPQS